MKSIVAAVVMGGLVVAGCSSSSKSSSSNSSSSSSSSSSSGSGSGGGGNDTAGQIEKISASVQESVHLSFKAVYTITGAGQSQTITIEQKPPKTLFSTAQATVINDGTTTKVCTSIGGQNTCVSEGGANPLAGLQQLLSPTAAVTALESYKAQIAAHTAGVDVNITSETHAGLDSTCLSATSAGTTAKYCVSKTTGLLTSETAAGQGFEMTSYTATVPDSDFAGS